MSGSLPLLPQVLPGETAEAFLARLMPVLQANLDAIQSGDVGSGTATFYDTHGRPILTNAGIYGYGADGSIPIYPNVVQIDTQHLVDAAVETAKIATAAVIEDRIANAAVTTTKIDDLAVSSAKIALLAVGSAQIADLAVLSAKIADAAILTAKIGDLQVTTAKIDDLAVNNAKIANVDAGKITADTILSNRIYLGAAQIALDGPNAQITIADTQGSPVTRVKIGKLGAGSSDYGLIIYDASGSVIVSNTGLGTAVVGTTNIANLAVTNAQINDLSASKLTAGTINASVITVSNLNASNITTGSMNASFLVAGSITATQIAAATITGAKIASGTITASNITAGTITATEIAAATITGAKIATGTITATNIAAGTITATEIASATITGAKIAATTIAAGNIVSGTITTTQIAANTIVAGNIAAATITGAKIATGTITATNIAAGTITATEIAAGTITGAKIAAATIAASNIVSGTITATQIAAGTITADKIASATTYTGVLYVGSTAFQLDGTGTNRHMSISDSQGSPVERVKIGKLGSGSADWGITIKDQDGNTVFDRTGYTGSGMRSKKTYGGSTTLTTHSTYYEAVRVSTVNIAGGDSAGTYGFFPGMVLLIAEVQAVRSAPATGSTFLDVKFQAKGAGVPDVNFADIETAHTLQVMLPTDLSTYQQSVYHVFIESASGAFTQDYRVMCRTSNTAPVSAWSVSVNLIAGVWWGR